ncbi:hypothetical protein QYM36_005701, partial [Artemia franciscana]
MRQGQNPSTLNLVITNDSEKVIRTQTLSLIGSSDHMPVLSTIQLNSKPSKYTKQIKKLCNRKKKLWEKFVKQETTTVYEKYKIARNLLRKETRKLTVNYKEHLGKNVKENPKLFWKHISLHKPGRRSVPDLENNSSVSSCASKKANLLNQQFTSVMHWFTGPIADAIAQARSTKSYFVVYVKGTDGDAKTEEFTSLLNSEEMTSILDTENFVKIQLTLDTPECSQFSQIYPVILVPSMYFIDQQGSPVEVIGGHIGLEQLRDRILKLISKPEEVVPSVNKPEVTSTSQTLTDIESASLSEVPPGSLGSAPATSKETSDNQLATQDLDSSLKGADTAYTTHGLHHEAEDEPQIKKAKESGNVQDVNMETGGSDIAVKIDNGSADSSNENTAVHDVAGDVTSERGASVSGSLSLEERVEKARQLAEVIRFKKEREEKEKEKRIEIERRETLKNIQKFKREQEEKEMRELAEQRKKEKEADRLAREKVKKQIEQDRIDKAAKFSMQKHSDAELQKEAEAKKQAEAQAKSAAEAAAR